MRRAGLLALVAACVVVAGCTSSDDEGQEQITATLEIITTNIQSAVGGDGFQPADAGQELTVGDRVKTDDTGFAELAYHDGSWQRVENNATLTLQRLTDTAGGKAVETGVDLGRTWNRVRELSEPEDGYELETPVATASVRGTIFSTDCPTADVCEFRVIEGTVLITPLVGEPVTMEAPSILEVRSDEAPGEPQVVAPDVLRQDPWVVKNLGEDREKLQELEGEGGNGPGGDGQDEGASGREPSPAQLRTATLEGTLRGPRTGISSNYRPDHPNYVAPGSTVTRAYLVEPQCVGSDCSLTIGVRDETEQQPLSFDGTQYVQRQELVSDCIDDVTRQPIAQGVARIVVEVRWTPVDAAFDDGEWVVSAMTGTSTYVTEVLKPDEFTERCYWPTTDGAPPAQEVRSEVSRR